MLDAPFTEDITFAEVWKQRKYAVKVPMEEGVIKKWHYGRTVVMGDAAHKVCMKPERQLYARFILFTETLIFF
jgi:2-polyprenyl-6-methoxyphenol hydroxylase-like FAD-dependent oxidoreductase